MQKILGTGLVVLSFFIVFFCIRNGTIPCKTAPGDCASLAESPKQFWTYLSLLFLVVAGSGIYIFFKPPE